MTVKEMSDSAGVSPAASALVQDGSTPASYLDSLEKQELYQDAIRFLAQKLPTDVGVKWASSCIKELSSPESKKEKDEPLEAADQWVKAQGDPTRYAAKDAADKAKNPGPSKLVAMAVFMSGGSMAPPGTPQAPPPPNVAQKMVAGAILIVVVSHEPQKATDRYKQALKMGKALDGAGA
jgi:hypothetical protein